MTSCTVECTSIPDGFISADGAKLRLSVILTPATPDPANPAAGPSVDLGQWPTQVPALSFKVWAGPSKSALQLVGTIAGGEGVRGGPDGQHLPARPELVERPLAEPDDLDAYLSLLNGGGSAPADGSDTKVSGYDYSRLHQGAINRSLEEFAAAFASHTVRQGGKDLTKEFSGLALRAARDPNDPLVRIARTLKWTALSSPPVPDPATTFETVVDAVVDVAESLVDPLLNGSNADFAAGARSPDTGSRPEAEQDPRIRLRRVLVRNDARGER